MVVTIHQPDFIPWLGFFDRWSRSDVYVVLDTVQFIRRGWHHRDRIKTPNGPRWLTVPVAKKGRFEQRIADTLIDESSNWRAKHLSTLRAAYVRTSGFAGLFPEVEAIYGRNHRRLMDHNREFLELIAGRLGITAPMVLASDLGVAGSRSELLAGLVEAVGGDVYLTGTGARGYLDERIFGERCIEVRWQEFDHPVYPQLFGGFEPGMSALDYLMNGPGRQA